MATYIIVTLAYALSGAVAYILKLRRDIARAQNIIASRDGTINVLTVAYDESSRMLEEYSKQALTQVPVKRDTKAARKLNWSQLRTLNNTVNLREKEEAEKKADNSAYEGEVNA